MLFKRWLAVSVAGWLLMGCATSPSPAVARASTTAPAPLDHVSWVQRSAEYTATVIQTYRMAARRVDEQVAARPAGTWAVVLDADETVLNNLQYQLEHRQSGYSAESWGAWVRRREATPLPGVRAFLAHVHDRGGRIAIVTNRLQSECADTEAVFRANALIYDAMLCRADGGPSDKNPRFAAVAEGQTRAGSMPLDVVAFVGDNILDFPSLTPALRGQPEGAFADFGTRYFMLPNPMYGSWQ